MKETDESGRTIFEMLLVLFIIGLLSAIAIIGYTLAITSHRANETATRLNSRAITIYHQLLVDQPPSIINFSETDGFYKIPNHIDTSTPGKFKLTVENMPEKVCKKIVDLNWQYPVEKPQDCSGTANRVFTFKNDLSSIDEDQQGENAETCAAKNKVWCKYDGACRDTDCINPNTIFNQQDCIDAGYKYVSSDESGCTTIDVNCEDCHYACQGKYGFYYVKSADDCPAEKYSSQEPCQEAGFSWVCGRCSAITTGGPCD